MTGRQRLSTIVLSACLVALLAVVFEETAPQKTTEAERLSAERLAVRLDLPLSATSEGYPVGNIRDALESVDVDPGRISSRMTFFRGSEQPTTLTEAVVDLVVDHRKSRNSHDVYGDLIFSNHCKIANQAVASRVVARRADEARGSGWDVGIEGLGELGRAQCRELYQLGKLTSEDVLTGI